MFQKFIARAAFNTCEESDNWQARIDRNYLLEIDGITITLYRRKTPPPAQYHPDRGEPIDIHDFLSDAEVLARFDWINIIEVQWLSNIDGFPSRYWCFITESDQYLIPGGGHYTLFFEKDFIYKLPGYYTQQVVEIPPPTGFDRAESMWRINDQYPKRELLGDDYF